MQGVASAISEESKGLTASQLLKQAEPRAKKTRALEDKCSKEQAVDLKHPFCWNQIKMPLKTLAVLAQAVPELMEVEIGFYPREKGALVL